MDVRKQLSIKTGSVRRLGADYRSYAAEAATYRAALDAATQSGDAHSIARARDFVSECYATQVDIGLRLAEARTALQTLMTGNAQLDGSAEWLKAQQTLQDNAPQQSQQDGESSAVAAQHSQPVARQQPAAPPQAASFSHHAHTEPSTLPDLFSVAVYGGSQVRPGEAAYERAKQLGAQLAQHHFHIVAPALHNTTQHSPRLTRHIACTKQLCCSSRVGPLCPSACVRCSGERRLRRRDGGCELRRGQCAQRID